MKTRLLSSLYPRVIDGLPTLGTPYDMLEKHSTANGFDHHAAQRQYTLRAGATGFVTGLPGLLATPLTLPADMAGVAALQMHLAATFALAAGHDITRADTIETIMSCLLDQILDEGENTEGEEVAKRTGWKIGERLTGLAFSGARRAAIRGAARSVGLKRVPFLGGILGASSDVAMIKLVADCAKEKFLDQPRSNAVVSPA